MNQNEVQHYLELAKTDQVKNTLKQATQTAVDQSAFGAPWIVVKLPGQPEQCFFGSDRFHLIADMVRICTTHSPIALSNLFLASLV